MMSFIKKPVFAIFVIVALVFFSCSFMLQGSFKTMDDEISIVDNDLIKDWRRAKEIFSSSFFSQNSYYRPLVSMSFMAEYHLFGLNPVFYYLTNIFVHAGIAVLLYVLAGLLFNDKTLAFGAGLLFGIHPVHWEAVSNIPGRAILLCAFFYLLAFTLFCFYVSKKSRAHYAFALAAFVPALFCKESAGMLPVTLLCYHFIMCHKQKTTKEIVLPVLPFFGLASVYVLLRRALGITHLYYWRNINEAVLGFVTFLRSLLTHMRLMVLPLDLQFDRSRRLFTALSDPQALAILLIFILLAIVIFITRKRRKAVTSFLIIWFFIEFIPVSQFLVTIGVQPGFISAAEHFLYVPAVAAVMLLCLAVKTLYEKNLHRRFVSPAVFKIGVTGLLLFYMLTNIQVNIYASNEVAMFERTLAINPHNVRVRTSLAHSYAKLNRFGLAEHHYRKAVESAPYDARSRIGLGKALCDLGKPRDGLAVYDSITDPQGFKDLLAKNKAAVKKYLRSEYQNTLNIDPGDADAHYRLSAVLSRMGDMEGAVEYLNKTFELEADHPDALFTMASILELRGQNEQALLFYERLLAVEESQGYLKKEAEKRIKRILSTRMNTD